MSKRALKKYLSGLTKPQLEDQVLDLYQRFSEVSAFYNFVFNPKEEKLLKEAKFKISREYFPANNRKARARRSVAQKLIKHYMKLGVDPHVLADIMLFNLEIAQTFSGDKHEVKEAFSRSMFKSFEQAINYIYQNGLIQEYITRILKITEITQSQNWDNTYKFEKLAEQFNQHS